MDIKEKDLCCDCCGHFTASLSLEDSYVAYAGNVSLPIIVPVYSCFDCEMQYTDGAAEAIREQAVHNYLITRCLT